MCGKHPVRKPSSPTAALALLVAVAAASPARAGDGLWESMLEKFNVKAAPPGPAPGFVERTRPDPSGLGYMPAAVPHKVSPLPVKTADQIQAEKDALDAARVRQLDPGAPKPLGLAKAHKAGRPSAAPAAAD